MRGPQIGRHKLNPAQIERIVSLLKSSDMTMLDIARRMGISGSAVGLINKKYGIRNVSMVLTFRNVSMTLTSGT